MRESSSVGDIRGAEAPAAISEGDPKGSKAPLVTNQSIPKESSGQAEPLNPKIADTTDELSIFNVRVRSDFGNFPCISPRLDSNYPRNFGCKE